MDRFNISRVLGAASGFRRGVVVFEQADLFETESCKGLPHLQCKVLHDCNRVTDFCTEINTLAQQPGEFSGYRTCISG